MTRRQNTAGVVVLLAAPAIVAVLWLVSGHERLTKSGRPVEVTVQDDLFGGTTTETHFVPGPICGYYVGLDALAGATALAAACGTIWWWGARRRRRTAQPAQGASDDT